MVDVRTQYQRLKPEIDKAIQEVIDSGEFINGTAVKNFTRNLEQYLNAKHVITCGNGTDALQIALMAIGLKKGDEVIVPAFTYVATAEVIAILGLKPIMVDVDYDSFNITAATLRASITPNTKAVVPVNLYGQCTDLQEIRNICDEHGIIMIEDNAQAIGADFYIENKVIKSGLVGHIGCTSFYPSKNLGAFGDGGALYTDDLEYAHRAKIIANHGQVKKYVHEVIGCNSRLDSIQAAILNEKLKHLDDFIARRQEVADRYDLAFINNKSLEIPYRDKNSSHVFHQYTLKVKNGLRDKLKLYMEENGIPSMIYYPIPLYRQAAFKQYVDEGFSLPITEQLCREVISLPIHTEMTLEQINHITTIVNRFFDE